MELVKKLLYYVYGVMLCLTITGVIPAILMAMVEQIV